jgi:anthranilate/para-aminobenzoate synthase component I
MKNSLRLDDIFTIIPLGSKKRGGGWHFFSRPSCAYAYFVDKRVDLLSGQSIPFSAQKLAKRLDCISLNQKTKDPILFHFTFEFGYFLHDLHDQAPLSKESLLAVEIHYTRSECRYHYSTPLSLELSLLYEVSPQEYKKAFHRTYAHLLRGDTYQLNLTFPSLYRYRGDPVQAILSAWTSGIMVPAPYAHITNLPPLKRTLISNSPESLFEVKNNFTLVTRPIKGTIRRDPSLSLASLWNKLRSNPKELAELNIITDLLRNDLSRIERPQARVTFNQRPLKVPGLLHQYSQIEVPLSEKISLGAIIRALFPGGSISGAPKKRVLSLISSIEQSPREFYTGSTVLLHRAIIMGSINIRSAVLNTDERTLTYGSGGGITLLSDCRSEYIEMMLKRKSFINQLKN